MGTLRAHDDPRAKKSFRSVDGASNHVAFTRSVLKDAMRCMGGPRRTVYVTCDVCRGTFLSRCRTHLTVCRGVVLHLAYRSHGVCRLSRACVVSPCDW
eukprot:5679370-Prymnesium_polylepis.1